MLLLTYMTFFYAVRFCKLKFYHTPKDSQHRPQPGLHYVANIASIGTGVDVGRAAMSAGLVLAKIPGVVKQKRRLKAA